MNHNYFRRLIFPILGLILLALSVSRVGRGVSYSFLQKEIEEYTRYHSGIYGIYFEDLVTGASFGMNADGVFLAGSTIKLPIVLYLYELAAKGKIDLEERAVIREGDMEAGTGYFQTQGPGTVATLRELALASLRFSDNVATNALLRRLGRQKVYRYMQELGASVVPTGPGTRNVTSPRDMGLFLKQLAEFARTHPALAQEIITALNESEFNDMLTAYIPVNIVVAHKQGMIPGSIGDAGIIFLPGRPYILVLFMATYNPEEDCIRLAELSAIVYRFMSR